MKKSNNIRFVPNRTNLVSGDQIGKIKSALYSVINGASVQHVENRHGVAYLKIKAVKAKQKTPYDMYVLTYTSSGQEVDITKAFWKEYGKALLDYKTNPYRG